MNILIVGNVIKDVYLNLDTRTNTFETDQNGIKWLDLSFNASEHHFFNRNSSLGGAAVSLEVLHKFGLNSEITNSDLKYTEDGLVTNQPASTYRYILIADEAVTYLAPSTFQTTLFETPTNAYDYIYVDRSATLDQSSVNKILAYLDISPKTKLVLYLRNPNDQNLNKILPRASLIFAEDPSPTPSDSTTFTLDNIDSTKIIHLSEHVLSYQKIAETISIDRVDTFTHLSIYSIASATILGSFILGKTVEESLRLAHANLENSRLNSTLTLDELQDIISHPIIEDNLELVASNLLLHPKGILAADESGGSIHKKFDQLSIPDTYDNRRDYRNIFFTTPHLEDHVNGVILFDETARQTADNGQSFVEYLISKRIIPGIKVDQGLVPFKPDSLENITQGLDGLDERLTEYYQMGLRFAKWRAAFEIRLGTNGEILTPTDEVITENCRILAEYAKKCQKAHIVPIVEPEVVYNEYYDINKSAEITSKILDQLFKTLRETGINLRACILKVNMVLAGKNYETQSTPTEVGEATAKVLKEHVPEELAGIVFLSGGQTPEQATNNLAEIIKHGPFPWPVTFSFARALQDPALYAWAGDNNNADAARKAFLERLEANTNALKEAK